MASVEQATLLLVLTMSLVPSLATVVVNQLLPLTTYLMFERTRMSVGVKRLKPWPLLLMRERARMSVRMRMFDQWSTLQNTHTTSQTDGEVRSFEHFLAFTQVKWDVRSKKKKMHVRIGHRSWNLCTRRDTDRPVEISACETDTVANVVVKGSTERA